MSRVTYKGGALRVTGMVRGCEPELMAEFGWPWPPAWPFEVVGYDADGVKHVIAVCQDHETAERVLLDRGDAARAAREFMEES